MAELVELLALVATVVGSSATLGYWLGRRLTRLEGEVKAVKAKVEGLENEVKSLGARVGRLEGRVGGLRREFRRYGEGVAHFVDALLNFMSVKGLAEESEPVGLRAFAEYLARPRSKYYTQEVYERLVALLKKEVKDYTWEDVRELERIVDLMFREADETEDEEYAVELYRSAWRVRIFKAALAGYLLRKARQSAFT